MTPTGYEHDFPCDHIVELVTDYLEDRMALPLRRRFDAHLAICEGCVAYLEHMRETVRALGRIPAEEQRSAGFQELLEPFRGWRGATGAA